MDGPTTLSCLNVFHGHTDPISITCVTLDQHFLVNRQPLLCYMFDGQTGIDLLL